MCFFSCACNIYVYISCLRTSSTTSVLVTTTTSLVVAANFSLLQPHYNEDLLNYGTKLTTW